jgi:hypothetical protein
LRTRSSGALAPRCVGPWLVQRHKIGNDFLTLAYQALDD